jgi:hypothetical protein
MKNLSNITSVESKAAFQEELLEKFVQQNLPPKEPKQNRISCMGGFTARYKEIEYCAAETPVDGVVEIFYTTDRPGLEHGISVPVGSRFIVFCARDDQDDYKVAWSCSLS